MLINDRTEDVIKSGGRVDLARWQVPERRSELMAIPRTSVGNFDTKVLRDQYASVQLDVLELGAVPTRQGS